MLDDYDFKILTVWQGRGDIGPVEMSQSVNLSASQCSRRMQQLRKAGYIDGIFAALNAHKLGVGVSAYVMVTLKAHDPTLLADLFARIQDMDEVLECQRLTGTADVIFKVATRDLESFNQFLTQQLLVAPEIATAHSSIILENIKSTGRLPLSFASRQGDVDPL